MRSFRGFGESSDPWFRSGEIAVTTTIIVAVTGVAYMFIWAFEPRDRPISSKLWLSSSDFSWGSVAEGQVWRLITWPIANQPSIWTVILVAIFWMLGSQLEAVMGRIRFTWFLVVLAVVPAIIVSIIEALTDVWGVANGLRFVELGVLVAFAAHFPRAMFWPGIPAWGIAAIIVVIDALQFIDARQADGYYGLWLLFATVAVSLLLIRSMGFAEDVEWLPKVPLPAALGGDPYRQANRRRERQQQGRRGRSAHLSSVPSETDQVAQAEIDALLDKVAEHGMESLSKAERRALEEHSKRLRRKRES